MPRATGSNRSEDGEVQALFTFGYDAKHPKVERGEIFKLAGYQNDLQLIRLAYVAGLAPGTEVFQCGICGKRFASEETRTVHGDTWHGSQCECGWKVPAGTADPVQALTVHRETCDIAREARRQQREMHFEQVKGIKGGAPIVVTG